MSFPRTSSPVRDQDTNSSTCECYCRYKKFVDNLHSAPNCKKLRIRGTNQAFKGFISGQLVLRNPNLERFDAIVNDIIDKFQQTKLKNPNTNPFEGVTQF